MFVGFTAAPAWAEDLHVSGSYTGGGTLFTPCSVGIGVDAQGSGDWTALGVTTFTLHFCLVAPLRRRSATVGSRSPRPTARWRAT
jgi:hypothetical protein